MRTTDQKIEVEASGRGIWKRRKKKKTLLSRLTSLHVKQKTDVGLSIVILLVVVFLAASGYSHQFIDSLVALFDPAKTIP